MNTNQLRDLLKEVFYEDEYRISETVHIKYNNQLPRFNIKVYSKKMNKHMVMIVIKNYILGTTICSDVWEMIWTLPDQSFYMKIPVTVDVQKAFLIFSKEKLKEILLINNLNITLMNDMYEMKKNPVKVLRDIKLNELGI